MSLSFSPRTSSLLPCLTLALGLAASTPVYAGGPAAGAIVITDHMLNPALSSFQSDLKSEAKAALPQNEESESWKVHFVAHLKKSPGSPDVNIVFYELGQAAKQAGREADKTAKADAREPVQAYPIKTKQTATMLISEVTLKKEEGFKVGSKYQVLITRLINGKEEVYARTTLELKSPAPAKPEAPAKPGAAPAKPNASAKPDSLKADTPPESTVAPEPK